MFYDATHFSSVFVDLKCFTLKGKKNLVKCLKLSSDYFQKNIMKRFFIVQM